MKKMIKKELIQYYELDEKLWEDVERVFNIYDREYRKHKYKLFYRGNGDIEKFTVDIKLEILHIHLYDYYYGEREDNTLEVPLSHLWEDEKIIVSDIKYYFKHEKELEEKRAKELEEEKRIEKIIKEEKKLKKEREEYERLKKKFDDLKIP